jgi:hypothetical protein
MIAAGAAGGVPSPGATSPTAASGTLSPQNHENVFLYTPGNGQPFMTADTVKFTWLSNWFHTTNASTLNFFIGTVPDSGNVIDRYFNCPASTAPSCETTVSYFDFAPGTYYWGVNHEFPGGFIYRSDRWSFTVSDAQRISLEMPQNGATYSTTDDVAFVWKTGWWSPAGPSTLHFFAGTGGSNDNVVHRHYTCAASSAPACPSYENVGRLAPGTYVWGVDHEFPGLSMRVGPRRTFTVVERRVRLPQPPPARPRPPPVPPRPFTRGPQGIAVVAKTLSYRGGAGSDLVDVVRSGRFFVVSQLSGRLRIGRRCQRIDARSARCKVAGVRTFFANMGAGDDSVAATIGLPSTLSGGAGADRLEGGAASDLLTGGPGEDTLDGGPAADRLAGDGSDVMLGGLGNDELVGIAGDDEGVMEGGPGNDVLEGGSSKNMLLGGEGNDYLVGGGGDDTILAGSGADILLGGDGGDRLSGNQSDPEGARVTDETDLIYCDAGTDSSDLLDTTRSVDLSCENETGVGGVGGGSTAVVQAILRRPRGKSPYVLVRVLSRSSVEQFKVKLTLLGPNRRVLGTHVKTVRGRRWVPVTDVPLSSSVRAVEGVVVLE